MLSRNTSKLIYSLRDKKNRDEQKLFVAEGPKIINELILSPYLSYLIEIFIEKSFLENDNNAKVLLEKIPKNVTITIVNNNELKNIALTKTPNSIIALLKKPKDNKLNDIDSEIWKKWFLILEDVQEPGNVGTILRTAEWFGIKNIVCSRCTADIFNPKTIQSTMGAIFNLNILQTDLSYFIQTTKPYLYATSLQGDNIYKTPFKTQGGIILGNESKGVKLETIKSANKIISIPGKGKTQSLNVSVSFGIICSEIYQNFF
ncbi:MAG: TrmH family RNA methyltransferase [Solitalea-like symbiont of Acarus siro]